MLIDERGRLLAKIDELQAENKRLRDELEYFVRALPLVSPSQHILNQIVERCKAALANPADDGGSKAGTP